MTFDMVGVRRRIGGMLARTLAASLLVSAGLPGLALGQQLRQNPAVADQPPLRDALTAASPEAREFHDHVITLTNPFFEGRSADTRGNALAAEYLRFHFERLGLEGAFPSADGGAAGPSFMQPFNVPGEVEINRAALTLTLAGQDQPLELGTQFNPLGFSGVGQASGPLVFIGYAIEGGPEGYTSFKPGEDLTGKIVVMLRFEPVNDKGESKWSEFTGWSRHAALLDKVGSVATRGAAGIILVNPPGVTDPRSRELEKTKSTRFGRPAGVPVVMLSNEQAKALFRRADDKDQGGQGRDLMDFRRLADAGGHGVIPLQGAAVSMDIDVQRATMTTSNVGALIKGKGQLAEQFVIVGAHYDHLGYGYVGGSDPSNLGKLHPGADDNASGTAGLLLLARDLKARYDALPETASARGVLLLAFSAEEMGLLGAEHFVRNAPSSSQSIYAMLNMDMIGRLRNGSLEVSGFATAEEFDALLTPLFESSGLKVKTIKSGMGPSDHAAFHRAGTPVLAFFTGLHAEYHKPADLPHTLNHEGAVRVARLAADVAFALAQKPEPLTFKQTSGPMAMGPGGPGGPGGQGGGAGRAAARVRLGITPGDYSGVEPGVLVGEVAPDTSADKGGMKKGDRIIRWGGEEIADAGAMMARLRDHKPGDVVEIVVVREGAELTLPVKLLGRGGTE